MNHYEKLIAKGEEKKKALGQDFTFLNRHAAQHLE